MRDTAHSSFKEGDQRVNSGNSVGVQVLITQDNLTPVNNRRSLGDYISRVFDRTNFIWSDARAKAFQAGRDTYLGKIWLIGEPLLTAALYGMVFGLLLRTSKGIDNFIGFLLIGVMFFGMMNKIFTSGSGIVRGSKSLISAFDFPIIIVPIATALKLVIDALPGIVMSVSIALLLQLSEPVTLSIIIIPPVLVLMAIFATGLSFFAARISAFFPDARIIIGFVSSAWFFTSGVFYSLQRYASHPTLYAVLSKNPGYFYVQAIRDAVLDQQWPSLDHWFAMILVAFATFTIGFIFFWRGEERYRNVL